MISYHSCMKEAKDSDSRPSRRERELARHRRDILAAAVHLFAENGYHETTMQMIADAAEFSVGYLYKHFPGKEEMYRDLVAYHVERMDEILAACRAEQLSPLAELRRVYEATCAHFNDHRDFMRIYHQHIGSGTSCLAARKREHFASMVDLFGRAVAAGELQPVDPRLLAAIVQGASQELFHELASRDVDHPFDTLPDTLFTFIIDPLRATGS